ncbi:MAG: FCD domain-containing protein, partial [Chloroflexales bacterium]|nr:FCD domain-containing protein [Chloroflexales bacterium]
RIIEVEAARVAAERAEPDDLAALERELHQMEAAGDDFAAYFAADMQFHRLVSHATHNAIVGHIVDNLIGLLTEALREGHGD